ncbi:MAG: (d)CMP kinase [Chloroflexota bacterium]|nr:(d)CMP kinase [Chloroflexota bacterium]
MSTPRTIALDGPAGVGKSTIGKLLADRHRYLFLDTGVLYRAVSLAAVRQGIAPVDAVALREVARDLDLEIQRAEPESGYMYRVSLDGEDVTEVLRSPEVEQIVSEVSALTQVRAELLHRQREIARANPSVLVGRDIGTVVLPNADLKVYLDATLEERTMRRHRERLVKDPAFPYERVLAELQRRDMLDTERATSPLRVPDDALLIDTTGKDVDAVLLEIEARMTAV